MEKDIIEVPDIYPMTWQYSPAIAVSGGRTLFVSGIIGACPDGSLPRGDIVAQAELAFQNLSEVLVAAGGTLADIVKVTIFVDGTYPAHAGAIREVRSRFFPKDYPTSTLIQVAGFANPEYLFEIEAVAVLPERAAGGLVIVRPTERRIDASEQTSGMRRESGVSPQATGSHRLWAGYVETPPGSVSGAHHHGGAESAIFMLSGRARFRWGADLQRESIAEPGDFVYVPPNLVHAEENLSDTEPVVFIVARNSGSMSTVNVASADRDD